MIIGVSRGATQGPLESTISDLGIGYLVAEDSDQSVWDAYGMRVQPSWAFIGPDGALVDRGVGVVTNEQVEGLIVSLLPS